MPKNRKRQFPEETLKVEKHYEKMVNCSLTRNQRNMNQNKLPGVNKLMDKILKMESSECWPVCRKTGTLLHAGSIKFILL